MHRESRIQERVENTGGVGPEEDRGGTSVRKESATTAPSLVDRIAGIRWAGR